MQRQGLEEKRKWRSKCFEAELGLGYVTLPEELSPAPEKVLLYLEPDAKNLGKEAVITSLNQIYFDNRAFLNEYQVMQNVVFGEMDDARPEGEPEAVRQDFTARYQGTKIPFTKLLGHLEEDIAQLLELIKDGDRELF